MKAQELLLKRHWYYGRMISFSKSVYRKEFPNNDVIFNANIFNDDGKIWYGDIDLTLDSGFLQEISNLSGENLYVLYEKDGRFENEYRINKEVVKLSRKTFKPSGKTF